METTIFLVILAGLSTPVVCQTPCPSHLACGEQTQDAYNNANGSIQMQCNALYEGLMCLETAVCPKEYKVGLEEALVFAKQELYDLNCTYAYQTTAVNPTDTGISLGPVWEMVLLVLFIPTFSGIL